MVHTSKHIFIPYFIQCGDRNNSITPFARSTSLGDCRRLTHTDTLSLEHSPRNLVGKRCGKNITHCFWAKTWTTASCLKLSWMLIICWYYITLHNTPICQFYSSTLSNSWLLLLLEFVHFSTNFDIRTQTLDFLFYVLNLFLVWIYSPSRYRFFYKPPGNQKPHFMSIYLPLVKKKKSICLPFYLDCCTEPDEL